ncbi:helix-turn-helix transcriptional regulator [Pelagerythrobacter marensis]|uniref:Helix-turn-helix transcriptional regulator n=1 Tax=Pelagerythrobacter marensis TaxID=543877 RepID=A0ABZ2D8H3_9SPHN
MIRGGVLDPRYQQLISSLVKARKTNKISQSKLAFQLGRAQQFVSRYEHSERRLDIIEYVDIASALHLDPVSELKKVMHKHNRK